MNSAAKNVRAMRPKKEQEGREVPGAGLTQSDESLCATQNAAGTFSAQTRRQLHGFVSGMVAVVVSSHRRCQELSLCHTQPVSAGSKMDPLLFKAEPISDVGGTSMLTYSRKGKKERLTKSEKSFTAAVVGVRMYERNNSADTKVSEEGEGGGASGAGEEIPLQPSEKTMVKQLCPLQPREDHVRADIHTASHGGPYVGASECAQREAEPMKSLH
ncbi:uncharacterized protein LOC135578976 [Columba livia]|uniref:uncharacterized protein LOC135578976 n=1 Tax=Columba livia TaxID=8932 RepID=UPI0031B9B25E